MGKGAKILRRETLKIENARFCKVFQPDRHIFHQQMLPTLANSSRVLIFNKEAQKLLNFCVLCAE